MLHTHTQHTHSTWRYKQVDNCKHVMILSTQVVLYYQKTYLKKSNIYMCECAKLPQSCPTVRDLMGSPGSSVHGILQARILEWVVMLSSRGSFPPRDQTLISFFFHINKQVLYHLSYREVLCFHITHRSILVIL